MLPILRYIPIGVAADGKNLAIIMHPEIVYCTPLPTKKVGGNVLVYLYWN